MMKRAEVRQLQAWLDGVDRFNATPGEGTTRGVYTPEDAAARDYVKKEMEQLGLTVRQDPLGNLFGELAGSEPELAPVWTGSHIDTVPNGGKFDGLAGVFAGMEALRLIKESGLKHRRTLSVNVYSGEEMSRFGICCIGSRALTGRLKSSDLRERCSPEGQSIYEAIKECGYEADSFDEAYPCKKEIYASLELHIEQNNKLEKAGLPLGIVTGICAPTNLSVVVKGVQTHAGGTGMADRRDAFMAAAEMAAELERLARESKSAYITGTVGHVEVLPNAANVIPGEVRFTVDIRSVSAEDKDELYQALLMAYENIAQRRGVKVEITLLNHDKPLLCDEAICELLRDKADGLAIPCIDIVSGPYHDSLLLGDLTRVGMLFVPSRDGISHDRNEWTDTADIARGADVLAEAMLALANEV